MNGVEEPKTNQVKAASILFPHQLFEHNPLLALQCPLYVVEEPLFFTQFKFHKQKIAFHRASMKCYQDYLQDLGCEVIYIDAAEATADIRELLLQLACSGIRHVNIIDPVDDWLYTRISRACKQHQMELQVFDSPMFLNTQRDLQSFFNAGKKKFFQTEFYKQERIRRHILLDASKGPEGGKWTFDTENRKKYPKGKRPPLLPFPEKTTYHEEAQCYTNTHFPQHLGQLADSIQYPINFSSSLQWLRDFLKNRLHEFGAYEDAMVLKEQVLHHSLLTPMLNVGLLTPEQVLQETLHYGRAQDIPIQSLEGFIRQLIGWREFIRGVYITKGRAERTRNFWGVSRKIPGSFYTGTTGILPVDETIKKLVRTGYCHHIERLMVLGNFMLLCEFDPDEVYRWFMECFIDAYDWVMVPNVYGMSQFADGGLMSTKPYFSGSNYLMKMSDFPKGDWQEIWDALFWRFMDTHRAFFLSNPRLSMLVKSYDRFDTDKQQSIHQKANHFLRQLDSETTDT